MPNFSSIRMPIFQSWHGMARTCAEWYGCDLPVSITFVPVLIFGSLSLFTTAWPSCFVCILPFSALRLPCCHCSTDNYLLSQCSPDLFLVGFPICPFPTEVHEVVICPTRHAKWKLHPHHPPSIPGPAIDKSPNYLNKLTRSAC